MVKMLSAFYFSEIENKFLFLKFWNISVGPTLWQIIKGAGPALSPLVCSLVNFNRV